MPPIMLVDATDLTFWAQRREAQSLLPQVIRRLVHATADRVIHAGFRAGEGVQLAGWDGVVVVEQGNAFIPDGTSAWELGTSSDVKGKADDEYEKRTGAPGNIDPSQSAFIFVTPRRWKNKDSWASQRQAEGHWVEVRVYDADDLEQWLELAPVVHNWLSIQLGKFPEGATDLGSVWEDWASVTEPAISSDLVLAGRAEVIATIHKWLSSETPTLAIKGESRDEALAIFAASVQKLGEKELVGCLSRTIVVRNLEAWHRLTGSENKLILISLFDSPDAIARATRNGHRVVLPLGPADGESPNMLKAPRLSRSDARDALVASGIPEDQAVELAALARRSLMSFRRKVAMRPEVQQPDWARPAEARALAPALMVGRWAETAAGDRQVLATLAQAPYEMVSQIIVRWANEPDPPVRTLGGAWFLTSKEDAWQLLSRYLTGDDLQRFEQVVLEVLGAPDPRFDLSKDERYMASILGKTPQQSGFLRKELADTLAFMGSRGESLVLTGSFSLPDWAKRIVRRLLDLANKDWRVWASISDELPLLAEAAPDAFLSAVENGLTGGEPVLMRLFTEQEDALFGRMPHTGLLWALETMAWNPEHLSHVALLLTKLTQLVPDGNPSNHLKESLRGIFLLWRPQTTASLEQRLQVIDVIRARAADVGWSLLAQLLPKDYDVAHNNATTRWRDWSPPGSHEGPRADYGPGVKEIIARVLDDVGEIGARWEQVIWALPQLGEDSYQEVIKRLSTIDLVLLPRVDRESIWDVVRRFIAHHRSFPDAEWALPKAHVDRLIPILTRFEPADLGAKYGWLFDHSPSLPERQDEDWHAQQKEIETLRSEAVLKIYAHKAIPGLLERAGSVERPLDLGISLGESTVAGDGEDDLIRTYLAAADQPRAEFARGFVVGRIRSQGITWAVEKLIGQSKEWSPEQGAEFLICLPIGPDTWKLAEVLGPKTERCYWRLVHPYALGEANVEEGTRKLLAHDRPHASIELLSVQVRRAKNFPITLVAEALERLIEPSPDDDRPSNSLSRNLSRLLNVLASSNEIDESRIARIEWFFLPALSAFDRQPEILHRELAKRPGFFSEVVSLVFPAEGRDATEVGAEDQERGRRAYRLLQSWRKVPGAENGTSFEAEAFKDWVRRARELLTESGRLAAGDQMLGQVLSGAPSGEGGKWPHPAVCEIIEESSSQELEHGIEIGLYNSRGVVMKNPAAGGVLERELAERYASYAESARERWPRTAAMLRRVSDDYKREAKAEDQEVQLRDELG